MVLGFLALDGFALERWGTNLAPLPLQETEKPFFDFAQSCCQQFSLGRLRDKSVHISSTIIYCRISKSMYL